MIVRLLLSLLIVVASLAAQDPVDETPAFGLGSSKTFAAGEAPQVSLLFRRVNYLDFRVYRVRDVTRFFQNLKDPHQFGAPAHTVPTELTPLEKFHRWKNARRSRIRDFFRGQFSHETRTAWQQRRQQQVRRLRMPVNRASFAQVPLLNSEQLAVSWRELLPNTAETDYRQIPIEVKEPGVYLVEAVNGPLRAYTVTIVSNIGIITKSLSGRMLAFVSDRFSGKPLAGAEITVVTPAQTLITGRTDGDGLFAVAPPEQDKSTRPTVLLARNGSDVAVTDVENYLLWQAARGESQGLIYTDRPVYRPGQSVYFKGISRNVRNGTYSVSAGAVTVAIRAPDGRTVYKKPASFNAFGSFSGEFAAPPSAALGYYSISTSEEGSELFGSFQVEEYKKPEYEVRVIPSQERVVQGAPIRATVEARYFFGEPVAGAKLAYAAYRQPYWSPLRYAEIDDEDLEQSAPEYYDYGGRQQDLKETKLDSKGRAEIEIPTEADKRAGDVRFRIEARVTDAANREISGQRSVVATYSDFLISASTSKWMYQPGESVRLAIRSLDYDGKPVSKAFSVEVRQVVRDKRKQLSTSEVSTAADGTATAEFPAQGSGSVEARIFARDSRGREVQSLVWLYVAASTADETAYERVEIIPDKKSYAPGETAKILVVAPVEDYWALVSIEGHEIFERRVIHSAGRSFQVEFPLAQNYAPNVFCSVAFLKKNTLYEESRKISVPAADRRLKIEVTPDKPQYRPNDKAEWRITALDHAGKPAVAEVSLGVVDEAIYGVRPDMTPDLMRVFYGPVYNRVRTDYSTEFYFQGWSGEKALTLAWKRAHTLADFKSEGRPVQPKVRKYFPDTIYWTPSVVTGADGTAVARMEFPDSVTAWRATARAVTADTRVGGAVEKVITRKNFVLRLETPRFLIEKDEVVVSAIVHNYLANDKQAQVSLSVSGAELLDAAEKRISVASRGQVRVDWRVRASSIGTAAITAKALTDEESDAVELPLPVLPSGVRFASAAAGLLTDSQAEIALNIPSEANDRAKSLRIHYAPSLAGSLFSAMDYLSTYPYGCVEQTMSSFLPNVILRQAMASLGVKAVRDQEELDRKINLALSRLYEFQHDDGGFGWWLTDPNHPFMTAYVLEGLTQAAAAGYPVRKGPIERARNSLGRQYQENPRAVADLKVYMIRALAMSGEAPGPKLDEILSLRSKLSPVGRAYLAQILLDNKDPRGAEIAREIESSARVAPTTAYWETPRDELLDISWDNSKEATALSVQVLAAANPGSPLIPKAIRWLMEARTGYCWDSTKQTAFVIRALAGYLKTTKELQPNYKVRITVNGKEIASDNVTPDRVGDPLPREIVVPNSGLQTGSNQVRIQKEGAGAVYWSAAAEYFTNRIVKSSKLSISREYSVLVPEKNSAGEVVYREEVFRGVANIGDILLGRITVTGDEWRYVVVEDPIPAGTEPIEREDLYAFRSRPSWWETYFSRREFHDDRVALFRERLPRGQTSFHYLLKVIRPGAFEVPPARVEPMYQPGELSTSGPTQIRIVEQSR